MAAASVREWPEDLRSACTHIHVPTPYKGDIPRVRPGYSWVLAEPVPDLPPGSKCSLPEECVLLCGPDGARFSLVVAWGKTQARVVRVCEVPSDEVMDWASGRCAILSRECEVWHSVAKEVIADRRPSSSLQVPPVAGKEVAARKSQVKAAARAKTPPGIRGKAHPPHRRSETPPRSSKPKTPPRSPRPIRKCDDDDDLSGEIVPRTAEESTEATGKEEKISDKTVSINVQLKESDTEDSFVLAGDPEKRLFDVMCLALKERKKYDWECWEMTPVGKSKPVTLGPHVNKPLGKFVDQIGTSVILAHKSGASVTTGGGMYATEGRLSLSLCRKCGERAVKVTPGYYTCWECRACGDSGYDR